MANADARGAPSQLEWSTPKAAATRVLSTPLPATRLHQITAPYKAQILRRKGMKHNYDE